MEEKQAIDEVQMDEIDKNEGGFGDILSSLALFTKTTLNDAHTKMMEQASKTLTAKMPHLENWNKVPMKRRRQTFAVFIFMCMMPFQLFCWIFSFWMLTAVTTAVPMTLYFIWILRIDNSSITGKREPTMRDWLIWRYFCEFFPMEIHKTTHLDPEEGTFLFGYHPHGIISLGAAGNFATNATGFKDKFPGINIRLGTLATNFRVPFQREVFLGCGMVAASRQTCKNILGGENGNAIMLVIGGASESLDAHKGTYKLSLYRKGFVRQACIHGSSLVPVISFGETDTFDLFNNPPGSSIRKVQEFVKRITGVAPAFFSGRQIFDKSRPGFLPHRAPITSVVGAPIKCPKLGEDVYTNPDHQPIIDEFHAKYVLALKALFDNYKEQFALKRDAASLVFTKPPPSPEIDELSKKDL